MTKFTPPDGAIAVTMDAIPDASTLAPSTRIYVLPDAARGRGFLAAFGRRTISRSARCEALLVRGYSEIGATIDKATKIDLVFARS